MHCLTSIPQDSIHAEILKDNNADAQEHPSFGKSGSGIVKHYSHLSKASPVLFYDITGPNSVGFEIQHEGSALQGLGCSA